MKRIMIILLCLVMGITLIGCEKTESPSIDIISEEDNPNEDIENKEVERDDEGKIVTDVEAGYIGQIDGNSVEIILDEAVPVAFRVPEKLKDEISTIKDNSKVQISYIEKVERSEQGSWKAWILTAIEEIESQTQELPETKKLDVFIEGMVDEREATLYESENDFYIYLLEGYSMEEINEKRVLTMDYDPEFYVEISSLPKDLDQETWEKNMKEELNKFGDVHVLSPSEHFDPYYHDADHYLLASVANKGSYMVMVKRMGDGFIEYKMNIPLKEAAEGAGPAFWAMLKTIAVK